MLPYFIKLIVGRKGDCRQAIMEDIPQLRESMKQLLDIILGFFEEEMRMLDSVDLKEEEELLLPAIGQDQNL